MPTKKPSNKTAAAKKTAVKKKTPAKKKAVAHGAAVCNGLECTAVAKINNSINARFKKSDAAFRAFEERTGERFKDTRDSLVALTEKVDITSAAAAEAAEKAAQPHLVTLKNGTTRNIPHTEAIAEIWEMLTPFREIAKLIEIFKKYKKTILFGIVFILAMLVLLVYAAVTIGAVDLLKGLKGIFT